MGRSFDLLPTDTSLDAKEGIMLQVFSILTSAAVEVKHRRMREFIRRGPSELIPGRGCPFLLTFFKYSFKAATTGR